MTDANTPIAPEPQTDLLRTPVLAQRYLDQYPGFVPLSVVGPCIGVDSWQIGGLGWVDNP